MISLGNGQRQHARDATGSEWTDVEAGTRAHRSQDDYLRLATQLASTTTSPARHFAVAHVSMGNVARIAGVSRSAIYRFWPSRQDFWSDLVDYILRSAPEAPPLAAALDAHDPDQPEAGYSVLDTTGDVLLADPLPLLRAAIAGYPGARDEPERRHATVAGLEAYLQEHIDARRTRCIDGLTTTDLAVAFTGLGLGLSVTGRMAHDDELTFSSPSTEHHQQPRTLFGVAALALLDHLTESDRDAEPRPGPAPVPAGGEAADPDPAWNGRREEYLRIGASLALGPSAPDCSRVLGHVRLDTLARAADVSRRTLSNVWRDQTEFRLDLFSHLLDRAREWVKDGIREATRAAAGRRDAADALLTVGDVIEAHLAAHADEVSFLAFAPHLDDPDVGGRALHDHDRHANDTELLLRRLLAAVHRKPRPGVSRRHIAVALFMLADGTNRLARTNPSLVRDDISSGTCARQRAHSITGHAAAAILHGLTEPVACQPTASRLAAFLG